MELHAGNHCNARRACAPAPQAAREAPCRDLRINGPRRRRSWSNRGDDAHGCRRHCLGRRIALSERAGDLAGTGSGLRGTRRLGRELAGTAIDDRGSSVSIDVVPTDPASLKKITEEMVKSQYGWGADQMSCLDKLWMKESGWNYLAENAESGAYGIPQSWPAEKLATMGADWKTNPITQIKWGSTTSTERGAPCAAWNQHNGSY